AGDLSRLRAAADTLDSEAYRPLLRAGLDQGLSFAAARQRAVEVLSGAAGGCLAGANNNLGVEYLRALRHWGRPETAVFTIPRRGAGHGSLSEDSPMVSASRLRAWMAEGAWDRLEACLPPESLEILLREREQGRCPALLSRCESAVLARLRSMTEAELARLPDWEPGLERRLANAAREAVTLAECYDRAKTRRCPEARVRRMALWAFLGLTPEQRPERVPYLRVLGCNDRGRELLRAMKETARLPVLTKPGQVRYLDETARRVFSLEARADDLWRLCLPAAEQRRGGQEWLRSPVILRAPD
ncbi:MAG: nucleotidyltransferase family protein, partial [Candidatus Onthomonas sp.]